MTDVGESRLPDKLNEPSNVPLAAGISSLVSVGLAGYLTRADPSDGAASDETLVEMTPDDVFEPAELTVSLGETVVWKTVGYLNVNALTANHTVTAYEDGIPDDAAYFASGDFSSEQTARDEHASGDGGGVDGGDTYEHTFDAPDRYEYFCIPHEANMTGEIVIENDRVERVDSRDHRTERDHS